MTRHAARLRRLEVGRDPVDDAAVDVELGLCAQVVDLPAADLRDQWQTLGPIIAAACGPRPRLRCVVDVLADQPEVDGLGIHPADLEAEAVRIRRAVDLLRSDRRKSA